MEPRRHCGIPHATEHSILVIGGGQAGLQVASSLRGLGHRGAITLVGDEPAAPYQRPPLSKSYLLGEQTEERLTLRGPSFYAERGLELVPGDRVESIELTDLRASHGMAMTRQGRRLAFDSLALTTGGAPRLLRVPGHRLPGVHHLRNVEDARALREALRAARRVVVVGGGFIGLEVAAAASKTGLDVTVVEAADRVLARAVAPAVSAFFEAAHRRRGTRVELGVGVEGVVGDDRVQGVQLDDGRLLRADVVVVGIGMTAVTGLAEQLGLECQEGIVVDSYGSTSVPSIVAAGDCTVQRGPGGQLTRLESVPNAVAQAQQAAATLLDAPPRPGFVPWFWSDQADLKLQIAGLSAGHDETVLRGEPDSERFSMLYYREGRLVAADCVNSARDFMAARRLLESGATVPPRAAADPHTPLRSHLRLTA